jgi:pimeloyl-ACP methyl ester carboxylesterase
MATGSKDQLLRSRAAVLLGISSLISGQRGRRERGTVEVEGETVEYEVRIVDARTTEQRAQDERRGGPDGNLIVVVPGHAQTVDGPKRLVATATLLSRSKVVWCIDPIPAKGGDRIEAKAIARVVRERISAAFPVTGEDRAGSGLSTKVTLVGWSHGGAEALRAAEEDPALFSQFLGLCPAGLEDRNPLEFVCSFGLAVVCILGKALRRRDWGYLTDALRVGADVLRGLIQDLVRSRSPKRLIEDVRWASEKVSSRTFGYTGEVVLLLGQQDAVIRWRDIFPDCEHPDEIPQSLPVFQREHFPNASRVKVAAIEGDHLAPEAEALSFVQLGLGLLDQLDESVSLS